MGNEQNVIMTEAEIQAAVNAELNPFAGEIQAKSVFAPDPKPVTTAPVVAQPPVVDTTPPVTEVQTPLGNIKIETPPVAPTTDTATLETLYQQMSEKLGVSIKSSEDLVNQYSTVFTKAGELEKQLKEVLPYKSLVEGLPVEIKNPLIDYAEGKDYKATLKQFANIVDIDITKEAKDIPQDTLIKHYNPDITEDELEAMEDVDKKRLLNNASQLYSVQRSQILAREQQAFETSENKKKSQLQAIDKTVARLKVKFPDMPEKSVNAIKETLINGVAPVLVDEKGYYKEEAGETLAMGLFGTEVLTEYKSKAAVEYQSAVQREIQKEKELWLRSTNDNLPNQKGSGGGTQINVYQVVANQLSFLRDENNSQFKNKFKPKE